MDVCIHIWEYSIVDNGAGIGIALMAWGLSTYCLWRLFQPSPDAFWNQVLERFQKDPRRWAVILAYPLIWAGYGFGLFELIDTQFDPASSQVSHVSVLNKTEHLRILSGFQHYVKLTAWPGDDNSTPRDEGPQVPAAIYNRLAVGKPACVIQHPGFLGARWYEVDACRTPTG